MRLGAYILIMGEDREQLRDEQEDRDGCTKWQEDGGR